MGLASMALSFIPDKRAQRVGKWLETADTVYDAIQGIRDVRRYIRPAWAVVRDPRARRAWAQAAAKVGRWGRILGKASGVASAVFGVVDMVQGIQKIQQTSGLKRGAAAAQFISGLASTIGGVALLTGAGAPVAAVAFGVAAVASGVSTALEIAGDPDKRKQVRQAVQWVGEKIRQAGQAVGSFVRKAGAKVTQVGHSVGEKIQQAGQAIGSFVRKAGGWLGSLVGGGG